MGRLSLDGTPVPDAVERRLAWLDRVGTRLRLPDARRDDVLEEIAAHLDDAIDALVEEGLTIDQAEREALARLGSPEELGDNLRRTHQTTRRLLAAAGGGAWKGLEGLFAGWLISFVWAIPLTWGLLAIGAAVAALAGRDLAEFEELMAAYAPMVGLGALWLAGRRATQGFARFAWRREHTVRLPIAALGFTVILLLVLTIPADQTWLSVLATLAMPFAFVAGAISAGGREDGSPWVRLRWPSRLPSRRKVLWGGAAISIVLPLMISVVGYVGMGSGLDEFEEPAPSLVPEAPEDLDPDPPAAGWAESGFTAVATAQVAAQTDVVEAGWTEHDGWTLVELADDVVDWDTLPGLQVELWRGSSTWGSSDPRLVDPASGPYRVEDYGHQVFPGWDEYSECATAIVSP